MTSYGPPPPPPQPVGYGYPQQRPGPPPGAPPPFPVWPVVVVTLLFSLFGLIPAVIGSNRAAQRREDSSRYWIAFVVSMLGALILYAIVFVVLVFVLFASTVAVVGTAISKLPTSTTAAATAGPCAYTPDPSTPSFAVSLPPDPDPTPTTDRTWRITTSEGPVVIALDAASAPCAVQSIEHLTDRYFYEGTECTRSVDSGPFLLECGDPGGSEDGPGYTFADENAASADYAAGVVAMANTGPDTNGSRFFIVTKDSNATQPKDYTVVGRVTSGLDTVTKIVAEGNDGSDPAGGGVPNDPVSIVTATVE
ncbi:peptidylprolyl isomerase [Jatrophihabitans sp. YIM 134969]